MEQEPKLHTGAAETVRALMARHGIAKHRQVAVVGEVFGLSRAAAHRRTHGSASWTVEELQVIAAKFGETLPDLLGAGASPGGVPATLEVGSMRLDCRIWLESENADGGDVRPFVAVRQGDGAYAVVAQGNATPAEALAIARIEIDQRSRRRSRIAVLAATIEAAQSLCDGLRREGYAATPYASVRVLAADVAREPFSGYMLEWGARGASILSLVSKIREGGTSAVIAVMSPRGAARAGLTHEIARASVEHDFHVFENPPRMEYVVAAFMRGGLTSGAALPRPRTRT